MRIVLLIVIVCSWAVAAWVGRYVVRGGIDKLHERAWDRSINPRVYYLLCEAAAKNYHGIQTAALTIFMLAMLCFIVLEYLRQ
jgi:hypothetical protein